MNHAQAIPGTDCIGVIRRRMYRTKQGRWVPRNGWKCADCGLHFFRDASGELVPGMNLIATQPATVLETVATDTTSTNKHKD